MSVAATADMFKRRYPIGASVRYWGRSNTRFGKTATIAAVHPHDDCPIGIIFNDCSLGNIHYPYWTFARYVEIIEKSYITKIEVELCLK